MAGAVDINGELKNLSYVFAGDARSHHNWRERYEIEIIFKAVEDFVGIFMLKIGFGDNENNTLPGFDDFTSETLVKFGMRFGCINEEAANIGLFDGGEAAEGAKFFNAHFALARLTEAGSIEQLDGLAFIFQFSAINVAGSAGKVGDHSLLLLCERIK